jgi:4-amino-4-deoxy-L-arabinose transferase-like glycosyltransferase
MMSALRYRIALVIGTACLIRFATLGSYPLTDNTEARYAEIARKMVETGQWLVPQIDYGVPFWGKPPLSFWLTGASYELLGVGEFSARLPSFMLGIAVCLLAYLMTAHQRDSAYGLRTTLILATTALMVVSAGSVMTDPAMLLGTTLSMVAFWRARAGATGIWPYAFFVGLAIGLLAKGPIAAVLTFLPISAWMLMAGQIRKTWQVLPWIKGSLLLVLLVVPWYWAAERQHPGFLHYFIIGEHWQRFTVSGWKGDLYGAGHAYPRGTIWIFAVLGTLPWSLVPLWTLVRKRSSLSFASLRQDDGWRLYLVCWFLSPILFFTLSRNILPTYVLPGLIGFSALVAECLPKTTHSPTRAHWVWLGTLVPLLSVATIAVVGSSIGFQSQKEIIDIYQRTDTDRPRHPLVYIGQRPYSAEFYTRGQAKQIDASALRAELESSSSHYYATELSTYRKLSPDLRAELHPIASMRSGKYVLLVHDRRAAHRAG